MPITPALFPSIINTIINSINQQAEEITALDQAIGDGDHVYNLLRGLQALQASSAELAELDWSAALQKAGMILMSNVGGASGSLYATLFISLSKNTHDSTLDLPTFASAFSLAVDAVKQRGKADVGEKTMLDVLIPVANYLKQATATTRQSELFQGLNQVAEIGVEATRDMLATKGRASFLGERSLGHIDAGAKTAQLMIAAITHVISTSAE